MYAVLTMLALMVGQIGQLMGPSEGNGSATPTNALTTQASQPLTAENGSFLVTE